MDAPGRRAGTDGARRPVGAAAGGAHPGLLRRLHPARGRGPHRRPARHREDPHALGHAAAQAGARRCGRRADRGALGVATARRPGDERRPDARRPRPVRRARRRLGPARPRARGRGRVHRAPARLRALRDHRGRDDARSWPRWPPTFPRPSRPRRSGTGCARPSSETEQLPSRSASPAPRSGPRPPGAAASGRSPPRRGSVGIRALAAGAAHRPGRGRRRGHPRPGPLERRPRVRPAAAAGDGRRAERGHERTARGRGHPSPRSRTTARRSRRSSPGATRST